MAVANPMVSDSNSSTTVVHDRHLQSELPAPSPEAAHTAVENFLSANYIENPSFSNHMHYVPKSNCDEEIDSKVHEIHRLRLLIRTAGIDAQTCDNSIPTFVHDCLRHAENVRQVIRSQWWSDVKMLPFRRKMDMSAAKALQPNPIKRWMKGTQKAIDEKAWHRARKTDEVRDKRLARIEEAMEMLDRHRVMIYIGESDFIWNPNCCRKNGVMQGRHAHGKLYSRHLEKLRNGMYKLRLGYIAYAGAPFVLKRVEINRQSKGVYKKPVCHWEPRDGDISGESYSNIDIIIVDDQLTAEQNTRQHNEEWLTAHTPTRQERLLEYKYRMEEERRNSPVRMLLYKLCKSL